MKRRAPRAPLALAAALCLAGTAVRAHEEHFLEESAPVVAPRFEPPAVGSYELPPIDRLGPHRLLGADGSPVSLLEIPAGEVAFVSFVYLNCGEACPLATATFAELDATLAADPRLAERTRLVTVSFDPAHDTPERMAALRDGLKPRGRWQFLTARSVDEIAPVLRDFGQDAVLLRGPDGDWTGQLRHVLKIFLVDSELRVRNVYSTGLLDPRLLVNDALTILAEGSP